MEREKKKESHSLVSRRPLFKAWRASTSSLVVSL